MPWLLASTLASKEFDAQQRLQLLNIPSYVPTYKRSIQPRHTNGIRIITYPLFARYLFLWMDNLAIGFETLRNHPHIWPARSDAGNPLFVHDHEVATMQERVNTGEFDQITHHNTHGFHIGEHVVVPIANAPHRATITHLLSRRRVRLLLEGNNLAVVARVELITLSQ
jgi:hypothetical protein